MGLVFGSLLRVVNTVWNHGDGEELMFEVDAADTVCHSTCDGEGVVAALGC